MPLETQQKKGPDWATGTILLLIAIAAVAFYDLPKYSELRAAKAQIAAAQNQLSVLNQQRTAVNASIDALGKNQAVLQQVNVAIPDKPQLADVFAHLELLAKASNMALSSVQADDPTLQPDLSNASQQAKAEYEAAQAKPNGLSPTIGIIPVRIELRGSVDALKNFLAALEQSLRLIDVQSINIIQGENSSLTFHIELNTYYQKK